MQALVGQAVALVAAQAAQAVGPLAVALAYAVALRWRWQLLVLVVALVVA